MVEQVVTSEPRVGVLNLMPDPATALEDWEPMGSVVPVRFDDDPRKGGKRWPVLEGYEPFSDVADSLNGLIVTGANLELKPNDSGLLPMDQITFNSQLDKIFKWAEASHNLKLLVLSCWASHFFLEGSGIKRDMNAQKTFGVYEHEIVASDNNNNSLAHSLGELAVAPHSRWGSIPPEALHADNLPGSLAQQNFEVVAANEQMWLAATLERSGGTTVLVQGHPEYPLAALRQEWERDRIKGQHLPENYFPDNNPTQEPVFSWAGTQQAFFDGLRTYLT